MSKSIEEYRNITKILKLQLLKAREDNSSICHQLGIASEGQTSSFTPKINRYKASGQHFAKNILAFLNFAHRCELVGITPEMIFRIADKQRDKKVGVKSLAEIMKRVKLRMNDVQINQLLNIITKSSQVHYEEYLQYLSAFEINAEKFPPNKTRTYIQLSLLKFGKQNHKKYKDADKLYSAINQDDSSFLTFENFAYYCKKNVQNMSQIEIVAIFIGLDMQSECQIQKSIFRRQMNKVLSLVEKGVNIEEESYQGGYGNQKQSQVKSRGGNNRRTILEPSDDDQMKVEEETGVEGRNKVVKKPKKNDGSLAKKKDASSGKLSKGDSAQVIGELKKLNVRISDMISKLVSGQNKTSLVKSYTINDFINAIKSFNKSANKKKIFEIFKSLDKESNGTLDTSELLKVYLRGKEMSDNDQVLYKLLYRHMKQIQYPDPLLKFQTINVKGDELMSNQLFKKVFIQLDLQDEEQDHVMSSFIGTDMKVKDFCQEMKSQGKPPSAKKFTKMKKEEYEQLKAIAAKINGKKKKSKKTNFRKLMRLETGEKSTDEDYWDTIYNDEWDCFQYCLQAAYKCETYWRDHQFGPTKSDPTGYRSIVGNESNIPPGLPQDTEISWVTFEELLNKNKSKAKVTFMQESPKANDVVQGKLGDCWFVSALSIIATDEEYFKGKKEKEIRKDPKLITYGICPFLFKIFEKYGIYVFKYFKKFEPIYVIVDDLFPIETANNQWLFAKSPDPGLQWVAFLQKSYAKLHHTYSNMISGDIAQGLNDLTNAKPVKESIEPERQDYLEKLVALNNEKQLMGCSISAPKGAGVQSPVTLDDERCGLFYGHAYSIIDLIELRPKGEDYNLLRVRNPWGHGQWILDWADRPVDDDPEYNKLATYQGDVDQFYDKKIKEASKFGKTKPIPYKPGDDGQFLMKYEDFSRVYTNLYTGYNFTRNYQGLYISQKWDSKVPGGICKLKQTDEKKLADFAKNNHQYLLEVKEDDTDVLMYIIQEDGRLYRGQQYPYKELCNGVIIFSFDLKNGEKSLEKFDVKNLTVQHLKFELRRDVNLWIKYKAGKYAIVPCKMQNKLPDTQFEFRIYSDKDVNIKKVKGHNNAFKPIADLEKFDADKAAVVSMVECLQKYNK